MPTRLSIPFLILLVLGSCSKPTREPVEYDDENLGAFSDMEHYVDMSQKNIFDTYSFCSHWYFTSANVETWVDGILVSNEEVSYIKSWEELVFSYNKTVSTNSKPTTLLGTSYSGTGRWDYKHNFLFIELDSGRWCFQVVDLSSNSLVIKTEDYPAGAPITPFHKDSSGRHLFIVYTYKKR